MVSKLGLGRVYFSLFYKVIYENSVQGIIKLEEENEAIFRERMIIKPEIGKQLILTNLEIRLDDEK
jgi:hypothetical protein